MQFWERDPCRRGGEAEGNLTAGQKTKPDAGLQEVSIGLTLNALKEFQEMKMKKDNGIYPGSCEDPVAKRGFISPVLHVLSATSILLGGLIGSGLQVQPSTGWPSLLGVRLPQMGGHQVIGIVFSSRSGTDISILFYLPAVPFKTTEKNGLLKQLRTFIKG